jgi:hypothetical protein
MIRYILIFALIVFKQFCIAQKSVTKSLKDFGAKGDGITNDMPAFIKATKFFNLRKGNGTLIIPSGIYMVGTQTTNPKKGDKYYITQDCLELLDCEKMTIRGEGQPIIKSSGGQRFGSFHPETGQVFHPKMPFIELKYRIGIGNIINLVRCHDLTIQGFEADGNITQMQIGGTWGDVGHQVPHSGIVMGNSYNITVKNVNCHHFGLDGIMIVNEERLIKGKRVKDNIVIENSSFEYNSRQGLSWVGGFGLTVSNSKFNHTGKNGILASPPSAGMDIEQEVSTLKEGTFTRCEYINNAGVGVIAYGGKSEDITFDDCTFWGTTAWSIWTQKTNYLFKNSRIYGSIVHANVGKTDYEATKFYNCTFENKPYKEQPAYGRFLVEYNFVDRVKFEKCTFNARYGIVPIWIDNKDKEDESAILLKNCTINLMVDNSKKYHYPSVLRNVKMEKTTFNIHQNEAQCRKNMDFTPVKTVRMKKSNIVFKE